MVVDGFPNCQPIIIRILGIPRWTRYSFVGIRYNLCFNSSIVIGSILSR